MRRYFYGILTLPVLLVICAIPGCEESAGVPVSDYIDAGDALMSQGYYDKAIIKFSKAIELEPDSTKAYALRADAYIKTEQYALAADDYTTIITLEPNAAAFSNRAYLYVVTGNYTKAVADCDKALEMNPEYAYALKNRGLAYKSLGQIDNASQDFNVARQLTLDQVLKKIINQELFELSLLSDEPPSFTPPAERVYVTYPKGGEQWYVGENVTITWTSTGIPEDATVAIMLEDAIRGRQTDIIRTTNTGSYNWRVTDEFISPILTLCVKVPAFEIGDYSGLFRISYRFEY